MPTRAAVVLLLVCLVVPQALATDWPQYRADAARSGYSPDPLPAKLAPQWVYRPMHAPVPAWRGDDTRMAFDYVFHTVIADGLLFFGSSADCAVHALDAKTGAPRWTFITDAPVRFAPAVWRDRVFAISDDGYLYCLAVADGTLLWKKRGGPDDSMVLGNDRMVSRRPARGGIAILDDIVYFAAGIWPTEGIYIYALDAKTGQTRWLNDGAGAIEMPQPHPTAVAESGVSAQGYLVAAGDHLLIPTGRAVPAAFNRHTGELDYFHLQEYSPRGRTDIVAGESYFANGRHLYTIADGRSAGDIGSSATVMAPEQLVWMTKGKAQGATLDGLVIERDAVDRKGKPIKRKFLRGSDWTLEISGGPPTAFVMAANRLVCAMNTGAIVIADAKSQQVIWKTQVEGVPAGLAVADKRLYVSTDQGTIYCFGKGKNDAPAQVTESRKPFRIQPAAAEAASAILRTAKVTEGYCVDLGCGDGSLSAALAQQSGLHIYAIDSDPANVAQARRNLTAAGLYGVRVTVHLGDPAATDYPDSFADLAVSGRALTEGAQALNDAEVKRLVRPYGGFTCIGDADQMTATISPPPENTGVWTHQYADPANTSASTDDLVRAPLRMLWFRDSDFHMPSRHGRGPAPLFWEGRVFVEGMHALRAFNAYNGRTLWEYPLPDILTAYDQDHLVGTAATGSNLCITENGLYVRVGSQCRLLDPATGEQRATFEAPGAWGYLASKDGLLFGSVYNTGHIVHWAYLESDMTQLFSESDLFFAMDAKTGQVKWTFKPKHSIRNNTIAIGDGLVYLIDRPLEFNDLLDAEQKRRGAPPALSTDPATMYALDAKTGKVVWKTNDNVYGTMLIVSLEHDILLMANQFTRFRLRSEGGAKIGGYRASDGKWLWESPTEQGGLSSRPVLIGDTVYNEPRAWNILTGKRLDFRLDRSYACGIMAGCNNMLVYRSATLGYTDLTNPTATINYGGLRPGCWINAIPVGGIVVMPDATARCYCSYLIRASIALQPAP